MILQMWGPHLNASTGYGESARALAAAWRSLGGCVTCREEQEGTEPGQPFLNYSWRLHDLPLEHRGGLVARVMAETSRIPSAWVRQLQAVDQVWVPSAFNREGFILSGVDEGRLRVLPDVWEPPGEMPDALPLPPLPSWRFLSVFNHRTLFRKGVDLLLRAYHRGFSRRDDVVLILRTDMDFPAILRKLGMTWGACAPRVHVVSHRLDEARMLGLYRSCNAFVLPSRGEGVGRPYLAALWTGLPVIASGWGGALSFLNGKNARLIPCRPFPARRYWRRLPHPWEWQGDLAEPDCDGLTEAMRDVFCSHPLTKTPGHLPEGCRSAHVAALMKG